MSAAILLLTSILPTDGQVPASAEQYQASLAELLSGSWAGSWTRAGQTDQGVTVRQGAFTLPMTPPARMRLTITAEGPGWFRGRLGAGQLPIVGIWKFERGQLVLCSCEEVGRTTTHTTRATCGP